MKENNDLKSTLQRVQDELKGKSKYAEELKGDFHCCFQKLF